MGQEEGKGKGHGYEIEEINQMRMGREIGISV